MFVFSKEVLKSSKLMSPQSEWASLGSIIGVNSSIELNIFGSSVNDGGSNRFPLAAEHQFLIVFESEWFEIDFLVVEFF